LHRIVNGFSLHLNVKAKACLIALENIPPIFAQVSLHTKKMGALRAKFFSLKYKDRVQQMCCAQPLQRTYLHIF